MRYSLCYKRPLTDILIVSAISSFIASYPVRNKDFGCKIQLYIYKKKKQKILAFSIIYNLSKTHLK